MKDRNWFGRYGFYESAEIKVNGRSGSTSDESRDAEWRIIKV